MSVTEKKEESFKGFDNTIFWVAGTVFSGILPYLAMLIAWLGDDLSQPFFSYYTGIADLAGSLYSVSLCLVLLCLDLDNNIDKKTRSVLGLLSAFFVIFSIGLYCHKTISYVLKKNEFVAIESDEAVLEFVHQNQNKISNIGSIVPSVIMLAFTILFICVGCCIIKKHEKRMGEDGERGENQNETGIENGEEK